MVIEFLVYEREPVLGCNDNAPLVLDCVPTDGRVVLVGNGGYLSFKVFKAENGFLKLPVEDAPVCNDKHRLEHFIVFFVVEGGNAIRQPSDRVGLA